MKALILALMAFASSQTGLPATDVLPTVRYLPECRLHFMARPGSPCTEDRPVKVIALYQADRIYLRDTWRASNVDDVASLLHELVHHLQLYSGRSYECEQEKERDAYKAQDVFLKAAGVPVERNPLWLLHSTTCPPPWANREGR